MLSVWRSVHCCTTDMNIWETIERYSSIVIKAQQVCQQCLGQSSCKHFLDWIFAWHLTTGKLKESLVSGLHILNSVNWHQIFIVLTNCLWKKEICSGLLMCGYRESSLTIVQFLTVYFIYYFCKPGVMS